MFYFSILFHSFLKIYIFTIIYHHYCGAKRLFAGGVRGGEPPAEFCEQNRNSHMGVSILLGTNIYPRPIRVGSRSSIVFPKEYPWLSGASADWAGGRIGVPEWRCQNHVFPIGGCTMVFPKVCFCYIRANGSKKWAKNTQISTFMIEKIIKFIENIKNLSAELKSVSQKSCAYIIASICPLGYLK